MKKLLRYESPAAEDRRALLTGAGTSRSQNLTNAAESVMIT
ncbi:MAG: hypothetical protein ACREDH_14065 [Methylocella sp.]